MNVIIRKATYKDVDLLVTFFRLAYGVDSALANKEYLTWFFYNKGDVFGKNWIALENQKIIAHYGILKAKFTDGLRDFDINFGVSSFTLPSHRGQQLSSSIFKQIIKTEDTLAVIGFTKKTKSFYEENKFNLHNGKRFSRLVKVINDNELKNYCDLKSINFNAINKPSMKVEIKSKNIINITAGNIDELDFQFDYIIPSTKRDKQFIKWRFLDCAFSNYRLYGYLNKGKIISIVVVKTENINNQFYCLRLVDVFGDSLKIQHLLFKLEEELVDENCLFLDYIFYGNLYKNLFLELNYILLEEDFFSKIPFYTDPIVMAENNEYFGLFAKDKNIEIDDFYLTKMNSDRDRLNKL
jgi:hypothetical protein